MRKRLYYDPQEPCGPFELQGLKRLAPTKHHVAHTEKTFHTVESTFMIYRGTFLEVCDNTGAQQVLCLTQGPSTVGDIIRVSIKKTIPKAKVKAGSLHYACITHIKTAVVRKDGHSLRTNTNCVALLDAQGSPLGTRITRPLPQDIRHGPFLKLRTLAPFVY